MLVKGPGPPELDLDDDQAPNRQRASRTIPRAWNQHINRPDAVLAKLFLSFTKCRKGPLEQQRLRQFTSCLDGTPTEEDVPAFRPLGADASRITPWPKARGPWRPTQVIAPSSRWRGERKYL